MDMPPREDSPKGAAESKPLAPPIVGSKPKKKRPVLKLLVGSFAVLAAVFFLLPLFFSTPRDSLIPRELHHLSYPGPRNDAEYRELVNAVRTSQGAPYHDSLAAAINRHANPRYMGIIVNEFLATAKSAEEFQEVSQMLFGVDGAIHSKAGLNTIHYPRALALQMSGESAGDTNETLRAWKERVAELAEKFPN